MPRDSNGLYTLPIGNPVSPGTVIESAWANTTLNDIAVQLNNVLTRDGVLGPTEEFLILDGSIASPGLAFSSMPGTGLWRDSQKAGFSYAGQSVWEADATKLAIGKLLQLAAGTAGAPSLYFGTDTDSGIYQPAVSQLGFSIDGALSFLVKSGQATFPIGTLAAPGISFLGDENTGLYQATPDQISIVVNGEEKIHAGANYVSFRKAVNGWAATQWPIVTPSNTDSFINFVTQDPAAAIDAANKRWAVGRGNTGDFTLVRYSATGAYVGQPFSVFFSTGRVRIGEAAVDNASYAINMAGGLYLQSGNFLVAGAGSITGGSLLAKATSGAGTGVAQDDGQNAAGITHIKSGGAWDNWMLRATLDPTTKAMTSVNVELGLIVHGGIVRSRISGTSPQFELEKIGAAGWSFGINSANKACIFDTNGAGSIEKEAFVFAESSSGVGEMFALQMIQTSAGSVEYIFNTPTGNPGESGMLTFRSAGTVRSRLYQQVQAGGGATLIYVSEFPTLGAFCMTVGNNGVITGYNGNCAKPGGGMWADSSDGRLKRDVIAFDMGMAAIRPLNPKRFKYIPEMGRGDEEYVGFVADEVEGTPLADKMLFIEDEVAVSLQDEQYEVDESYKETYTVMVPVTTFDEDGELIISSKAEPRLRTKTRKVMKTRQVPKKISLPGGIKTLNATPALYAMINALKELDARLTNLETLQ